MGMIHEHQNPRGKSIDWNVPKVEEYMKNTQGWDKESTDKNIIDRYDINTINGSDFDPDSIMLYFYPADLTLDDKGTSENNTLSITDMIWLSKIYPGGSTNYQTLHDKIYNSSKKPHHTFIILGLIIMVVIIFSLILFYLRRIRRKV
jgi:hypothetical protein